MIDRALEENLRFSVLDFKPPSQDLRDLHTQMIVKASQGDIKAKNYIKEFLRLELIRIDESYKEKSRADPIISKVYANSWGLGVLEKYDNPDVDELMIDGTRCFIEKAGVIIPLDEEFETQEDAIKVIRRVLEFDNSLDISIKNPKKQAIRSDGARITAAIPPMAKVPTLNIRKFESFLPTTENLINTGTIPKELVPLIDITIKGRANITVIGEMGAGKTAFIRWLLGFIPKNQRVGILETTFEINPEKLYPDVTFVQLKENEFEEGQKLTDLFQLMLRQNVKRMMLGEVRSGKELYQYKYACNRGHSGGIMSGHYMDAESFLTDGADMIIEAGLGSDKKNAKDGLAGTVDLVFRLVGLPTGKRVLASIEEIISTKEGNYSINKLWDYVYDENNPSKGYHKKLNNISEKLQKKLNSYGVSISEIERSLS